MTRSKVENREYMRKYYHTDKYRAWQREYRRRIRDGKME